MTSLTIPVVYECELSTLDAEAALRHLKEKHPDEYDLLEAEELYPTKKNRSTE